MAERKRWTLTFHMMGSDVVCMVQSTDLIMVPEMGDVVSVRGDIEEEKPVLLGRVVKRLHGFSNSGHTIGIWLEPQRNA